MPTEYVVEGNHMIATERTVQVLCNLPYDVTIARRAGMTPDELLDEVRVRVLDLRIDGGLNEAEMPELYKAMMLAVLAEHYAQEYRVEF